jgi:hypothetical protein
LAIGTLSVLVSPEAHWTTGIAYAVLALVWFIAGRVGG